MSKFARLLLKEWRNIFTNRTICAIVFGVPLLYTILFGFLYSQKKVTEIPTVWVDADQTELSRELYSAFEASQTFRITHVVGTEAEAMNLIDRGEVYMAVIVPAHLARDVKAGQEVGVLAVIDGSNMMISNTAVREASTIVKTVSAGVTLKKLEAQGSWGEKGKNLFTGIDYRYRVLYNPTFSYLTFMGFGLAGAVLQQALFLGVALSVTQQKEAGTWAQTLREHGFWTIALSKLLPYLIVATFNLILTYALLLKGFEVPYYGSTAHLLVVGTAFNLAVAAIGFAVSTCFKDQLQATQICMLIALPSFMLSGYTWPLMSMPAAIAAIGKSLPLTYFLNGVREILNKGHDLSYLTHDLAVLAFMTLVGFFAAYVMYLFQLRKVTLAAPGAQAQHEVVKG